MSNTILVTFATRGGSTAGVAEAIGKSLTENGKAVEVRPMQEVTSVLPYSAVVAGSAIQGKQWLPEAMQFLQTYKTDLNRKPFAAFLVCMTLAIKNEQWRQGVTDWLMPVRSLVKPVSEGLFAGVLDISKVPSFSDRIKFRVSTLSGVWEEGDHRDWDAIQQWANELPARLEL